MKIPKIPIPKNMPTTGQTNRNLKLPFVSPRTEEQHRANAKEMERWGNRLPVNVSMGGGMKLSGVAYPAGNYPGGGGYPPGGWRDVTIVKIWGDAFTDSGTVPGDSIGVADGVYFVSFIGYIEFTDGSVVFDGNPFTLNVDLLNTNVGLVGGQTHVTTMVGTDWTIISFTGLLISDGGTDRLKMRVFHTAQADLSFVGSGKGAATWITLHKLEYFIP